SSSPFCFQAEDGIRDRNVTGVQTCALPIFTTFCYFHMHFVLTCLLMVYFWRILNSIHFFSFTCIHHLFHPSSYVNQLSQLDSFSTILNIADRDRLFSFISSSVGKIGLRVINLNGASKPSGTIGIPFGTGF